MWTGFVVIAACLSIALLGHLLRLREQASIQGPQERSRKAMLRWAKRMQAQGYIVELSPDQQSAVLRVVPKPRPSGKPTNKP